MKEKIVYVYMDSNNNPSLVGKLYIDNSKGREVYAFEYSDDWIKNQNAINIDPDLLLLKGRQYVPYDKNLFGIISDSCPDRWGRTLMDRREMIRAREEERKPRKLLESDYLLGVYDKSRMGALRFSLEEGGLFISQDKELSTPPWEELRKLETASLAFEKDDNATETKWLKQLIAPGSSLGGARPKATVVDSKGNLWIAKFPSKNDSYDSGAWEMVVHDLAKICNIVVPEAKLEKYSENGRTFIVKRFDRDGSSRIHFSSAMTLLGKEDGDRDASYLDIASFIKMSGASPKVDLLELWRRIVFSIAVSNNDDHLRNHGFILSKKGWNLSPAYDINPNIYGNHLALNISDADSSMKFDVVKSVASYFELNEKEADEEIKNIKKIVEENWEDVARKYSINTNEIEVMRPAFDMRYKV